MRAVLAYPKELVRDVRLPGGAQIHIRPVRIDDEPGLLALFDRLTTVSRYQRFFSPIKRLPPTWVHHFANVNYHERLALVAERPNGVRRDILGVARYEPSETPGMREIAVVVEDLWQNRGLGGIMLDELLCAAEARGATKFCAFVLAENRRMLSLIARLGTIVEHSTAHGVVELVFTRK